MDREQIIEEAASIEDRLGDLKLELDNLTEEITKLKKETETSMENAKRHKSWYEDTISSLEEAEAEAQNAYDTIDTAQDALQEIK